MKEGKILDYDGFVGEIESENDNYIFLKDDLLYNAKISDIVCFRGEDKQDLKRAYFIKKKIDMKDKDYEGNNN